MLREKRKQFEDELQVPKEERLSGEGWVASFSGSVDTDAVEAEGQWCQKILAQYAPQDCWNFDKTSLFPFAPPDQGLGMGQMSGKKKQRQDPQQCGFYYCNNNKAWMTGELFEE
ncbi:hypothetical protein BS17DRAFT_792670 [Gyrodon lividus]|nr:hypothetical protein BS17DRAFT_792670 [Gyrodon lividus]